MHTSSPYRGLAAFAEEDSRTFFGREEEVDRSVDRLLANRFLAVVGPSGIGKSSLIRAGIIPQLKAKHSSQIQPIIFCRFGADPITNLATAVSEIPDGQVGSHSTALLVIDHFEELYAVADSVDRQNVLRELVPLVDDDSIALLISLRADFFGRFIETPILAARSEVSALFLGPLSQASLRQAILEPAELAGITFEDGLLDHIMAEVGSGVASLPLLQMLLSNLVSSDDHRIITLSDYQQHGSLHGALEQILEGIWHSLTEPDQRKIRSIMLRLVTMLEGGQATRRAVPLDDFSEDEQHLVNRLVSERILTVHQDPQSGQTVIEVTHEAIFREWSRHSYWLDEEGEFLRLRYRISDAARSWEHANRAPSYLLAGGVLEQAKELLHNRRPDLGVHEVSFIQHSINASDRFSAWKLLTSGLGLAKLQKEVVQRDERRAEIQEELNNLDEQVRQLETRKAELVSKLEENRQDIESMAPKVFLSYASEDFPHVKPLYDKLKQQGLCPWLDRENLLPGVDWDREIIREIKQSHFVLFCLSTRSISKRGYVQKELRTALRVFEEIPAGQTYLIPVRLEECTVPDELSKYHFADVFRDGEFDKLLRSILKTWADSKHNEGEQEV